jgi:FAD/FMN-containing dehydrogenase
VKFLLISATQQYDERSKDIVGEHYPRLSKIKAEYDPKNVFNKLFAITPATVGTGQA